MRRAIARQNARILGSVTDLPHEATKLLAVSPEQFVPERQRLARELRDAGRSDDSAIVGHLRKPTPVVLAVNRAARDRPNAARAAADAAVRVKKAQVGGQPDAYTRSLEELGEALDLLAEVAVAHVSQGKNPSDAVRRRIRDLLRSAVADETAREALARGVLVEEVEAGGFAPFAGMTPKPARPKRASASSPTKRQVATQRARARTLRAELARAEQELRDAERSLREAERERSKAERAVASARAKLDRLR